MSTAVAEKPSTNGTPRTEIAVRAKPQEIATVESIVAQCSLQALAAQGHFRRALAMATGIRLLKQAITKEMMQDLMDLQGTSLGFRTDKDRDGGYPAEIVKECAIEAALRGALWVGNEFNIIAGRAYLTKEFFTRALREFPGLTDLRLSPGVPVMSNGGALVSYAATWRLNGTQDRIDRTLSKIDDKTSIDERICVKVNSGMGADAILGKAERKIRAAIYSRITGSVVSDGDTDDALPQRRAAPTSLESLTQRLESPKGGELSHEPDPSHGEAFNGELPSLATLADELAAVTSKTEVTKIQDKYNKLLPDDEIEVGLACDTRKNEIDASRGNKGA
jgi:hypothetical protein